MKLKKKSGLIGLISVLAGVSVVSVGFAAWVVSAGDTKTMDGEIYVETVNDERHNITFLTESLAQVKYGAPSSEDAVGQVLSYKGAAQENLEISFQFKVRYLSTADYTIALEQKTTNDTGSVWYKADAAEADKYKTAEATGYTKLTGYDAALQRGYVGALPAYDSTRASDAVNIEVQEGAEDSNTHEATITVKLKFKWGSKFTGSYLTGNTEHQTANEDNHSSDNGGKIVNPYYYYNFSSYTNATTNTPLDYSVAEKNAAAADAVATLGNLNSYLTGVGYKMTITSIHNPDKA